MLTNNLLYFNRKSFLCILSTAFYAISENGLKDIREFCFVKCQSTGGAYYSTKCCIY